MVFLCKECGKSVRDGSQLKMHMRKHIKKETIVNTCCSYKGRGPHRCEECQKCFKKPGILLKHFKSSPKHSGIDKRKLMKVKEWHMCNLCGVKFISANTLKGRQPTHTGEKLFKCPFCDKKFAQSGTLMRHKRFHTGEKNYKCLECGKCFGEKKHLSLHEVTHTGLNRIHAIHVTKLLHKPTT